MHAQNCLGVVCVLVWCAVSEQGLIGPFKLEDYVTGENYAIMLDSFFLPHLRQRRCSLHAQWFQQDGARPHTTPEVLEFLHSKFQHRSVQTFPTTIPVRILTVTTQSRFKSVWLLHLGLSEGQSVQQCSPNSAWTEGEDQGKLCTGHKRDAHLCYTELFIRSSNGSIVPRGSHRACQPHRYTYVKF